MSINNLGIPLVNPKAPTALTERQVLLLALFAKELSPLGLGIHCSRCQSDLVGRNAAIDQTLDLKCKCRDFKADNPDQRPQVFDRAPVEAAKYLK